MPQFVLQNHLHNYKKSNCQPARYWIGLKRFRMSLPKMFCLGIWIMLSWRQWGPKDSGRAFCLPLNCLKEFTITRDNHKERGLRVICRGQLHKASVLSPLCAHCLCMAWQTFVYQTYALPIFLWIVFLPFEAPGPYLLLLLSLGQYISLSFLTSGKSHIFMQLPYIWNLSFSY